MTDDQIIHDVLNTLNQWDKDNRDTTMSIPFYIKEKFKLEERKCFDLTIKMVKAGLVYRFRNNNYLITDKGRKIGDKPDGWLGESKKNIQPPLTPFLYRNTNEINLYDKKPFKKHIPSWMIWVKEKKSELSIGIFIVVFSLILEYKSGFFIKNDTETQPPTDIPSRGTALKDTTVQRKNIQKPFPTGKQIHLDSSLSDEKINLKQKNQSRQDTLHRVRDQLRQRQKNSR